MGNGRGSSDLGMRWENVRSALPSEVATVPLEQVVELSFIMLNILRTTW